MRIFSILRDLRNESSPSRVKFDGINLLNIRDNMKRILVSALAAAALLTACAVVPAGRGYHSDGVVIAPILPPLVVLDVEPYYFYSGYHYHYTNDRWLYSRSRTGPWFNLPRDRFPREVRFKERGHDQRYDDRRRDDRRR